eukprot:TRINITY_DN3675_c0_g1_i1.p2 TRINITY_DN3675_c0_g1~~TRINITY_DN3675_c0_g1_i1.p2  ORF type:complete len:368 (+),score=126.06 TRINITY_DN3675_c0_g1_i1:61-1104(+)
MSRLKINGKQYVVVNTALIYVKIIGDYLDLIESFKPHSYWNSFLRLISKTKILEISKLLNSRSFGLILGAGAVHIENSHLKKITAKHLVMVTQTLSLSIEIIKSLLLVFENDEDKEADNKIKNRQDWIKLEKDCENHKNEIFKKIKTMMYDRLERYGKNLVKEGGKGATGENGVSSWVLALGKETRALEGVLVPILGKEQSRGIIKEVIEQWNEKFIYFYSELQFKWEGEEAAEGGNGMEKKKQMIVDVEYMIGEMDEMTKRVGIEEEEWLMKSWVEQKKEKLKKESENPTPVVVKNLDGSAEKKNAGGSPAPVVSRRATLTNFASNLMKKKSTTNLPASNSSDSPK